MKKYLEVDVGNSFCKWRLLQANQVLDRGQISTSELYGLELESIQDIEILDEAIKSKLLEHKYFSNIADVSIDGVYICSVASTQCNTLLKLITKSIWQIDPVFFKTQKQTAGVTNSYQDPAKMGADRWLASVAAVNTYPDRQICIVDCGSAINIEMLSSEGVHQGGYIIPGISMMQNTLLKNTAMVKATLSELSLYPGKETGANVANGSLLAAVSIVEKLSKDMGDENGLVIVTGGDSLHLLKFLDNNNIVSVPDLVLDGFGYWRKSLCSAI